MNNPVFVRSHVERCLQDAWGVCRVSVDGDGDYPFRAGTAAAYVRVEDDAPGLVRVFAIAANDVRCSAKLLSELNDVNGRTRTAHAVHVGSQVLVGQCMLASACTAETLGQACEAVSAVANDIGLLIATVFGGTTPFSAEDVETANDEAA